MSEYVEIAGSGRLKVTSQEVVRTALEERVERTDATSEDTLTFQTQVSSFWSELAGIGFSPRLIERVWVANRCIQLNAQQIARMPLRFYGTAREPQWVSNPDPVWFPNGIGDAVFAGIWSMYAWGDAFLYITARYSNGYPSAFTVLDPEPISVNVSGGRRTYKSGNVDLDPDAVVQISRDPRGIRGTSALKSYAGQIYGLLATSDMGRLMMNQGTPHAVLKMLKRVDDAQAIKVQNQWVDRTSVRRGAPPVLPPEIDFQQLAFSPSDLMLLEAQGFDARAICSAMGVPAMFLNLPIEGGLTYQTPGMLGEHWWRFELRPMAAAFSSALSAQMLSRDSYVEFDARDSIAPTFKELVEAWSMLVESGSATTEELRAAVLRLPAGDPGQADAAQNLITPPSAGASPAQAPSAEIIELRA